MPARNVGEIARIAKGRRTPLLVVDGRVIQDRYRRLQEDIGDARIYYAVKSNPHPRIIELLRDLGAHFEISSEEELKLLLRSRVQPDRIIASNPVKTEKSVRAARDAGVTFFAFDSRAEIEKLSRFAPRSNVYVRLVVSNEGSQWPLTRKFGVEAEDAVELLCDAANRGLVPCGLTFHVGSQCTCTDTWMQALEKAREVWDAAESRGIRLRMLNIGGGFPVKYEEDSYSGGDAARRVREAIDRLFPSGIDILVEPGRYLVGEAGTLVATIVGKAKRSGEDWLYLDVGVFNGLMESIGGIRYAVASTGNGSRRPYVLAGPSCDSLDIIQDNTVLPELDVGDRVYILSAGAYTTAYASRFDGLAIPRTTVV